jgi:hypothetical protein
MLTLTCLASSSSPTKGTLPWQRIHIRICDEIAINHIQTQNCCQTRSCFHHYGPHILSQADKWTLTPTRLLANQDWERQLLSTLCSPLPSRITPITNADMQSKWTRRWRLKSPRLNWKRNSSRVHQTIDCTIVLPRTDMYSSLDCN